MKHQWKRGRTPGTPDSPPEGYSYCENCCAEEDDDNTDAECLIKVEHSGVEYVFDPGSHAPATVESGKDYTVPPYHTLVYEYTLSGAHQGPPIQIKMVDVKEEFDENGRHPVWERLVYADNDELIDDVVSDFYYDALREDLEEIARETWD